MILKSLIFPPLERFGKPLLIFVLVSPENLLVGSPNDKFCDPLILLDLG